MSEKPITVKELIEILQGMPEDIAVAVDGYEWGIGRITAASVRKTVVIHGGSDEEFVVVYIDRDHSQDRESYGAKLEEKP